VATLKAVICGGSAVAADLSARFSRQFPAVSLAQVGFSTASSCLSILSSEIIVTTSSYKSLAIAIVCSS
jgi:hypothetical protein